MKPKIMPKIGVFTLAALLVVSSPSVCTADSEIENTFEQSTEIETDNKANDETNTDGETEEKNNSDNENAATNPEIGTEDSSKIKITFKDVTQSANTLKGEAKVLVSVEGANGNAMISQISLKFSGDLKYKSTQFLKGENVPENGNLWTAQASEDNKLMATIISTGGIELENKADLFIITFSGKPGGKLNLSLDDPENTYCTISGKDRIAEDNVEIELTASEQENVGTTATIRLVMDRVTDFTAKGDSGITVKITNEDVAGDVIVSTVNTANISDGGHAEGTGTIPNFVIENTVIADNKYTVEVSGIGYVTYIKEGVTFEEELKITNSDFIPGDVNNDGKVDENDKEQVEELISEKNYSIAADFNRDKKVSDADLEIFDFLEEGMGGSSGGNSGSSSSGSSSGSSGSSSSGSSSSKPSSGSGGSSGGSSGGGSGGGGFIPGSTTTKPNNSANSATQTTPTVYFIDLENHIWAKEAIYTLKTKGIISGISETEYAPANNIKRGDFILILTRMLNVNNVFAENFADVPADSYYYNAIGSARAAEIATGDGINFMPENTITRQDLITLAYRAFLKKGYITATDDLTVLDSFGDKDSISEYAKSAMASMVKAGIIQGSDGNVNPLGYATRAEVAVMCARMLELMK